MPAGYSSKRPMAVLCNFVKFRESFRQRVAKVYGIGDHDRATARESVAALGASPIEWAADFRKMVREVHGVDLGEQMTLTWFAGAVGAAHFAQEGERETELGKASSRLMDMVQREIGRREGAPVGGYDSSSFPAACA